jgi:methylphosphotriester-DNA--protein-cysteine methyltransferase
MVSELRKLILSNEMKLAGNAKLKIYGTLSCSSGKRMKKENRVFFLDEHEAKSLGFRPCGHCLKNEYAQWMSKNQVEN